MGTIDTNFTPQAECVTAEGAPDSEVARLRQRIAALDAHQRQLSVEIARLRVLSPLGEGVATIAHEIRNPLGAIAGFAELLARRCDTQPDLRGMSQKIMSAAQNLNTLVERLLELVRNSPMEIRPIEWPRFLASTVDQYEEHARMRGARLTLVRRWSERLGDGRADALCLRQAVWNILENAEQASGSSGEIEIEGMASADGRLQLIVADRGPGVDPVMLPKLFTPFVTTREQGTGLGLAMARKIVEAHGGQITIRNRDGGGAQVEIALPPQGAPTLLIHKGDLR
jgi:signal transduction histidine kinase